MALYLGKDLVSASSGLGGATIKNQDLTIKENGTYTAENGYTGLGTVTVDVPTGGGAVAVSPKDVNFYDYDGTLLHSYTVEEAQALTELPELPTQQGLICQGWNYDLETIKAHNSALDVGATYITDDGKTRLYIKIAEEGRMDVPLCFSQTVTNGVTIDWGDGSATETLSGTGNKNKTHTYANIGNYVISLDVAEGCDLTLGHNSYSYCVMGSTSGIGIVYCNMLQKVEIGNRVVAISNYAFAYCDSLTLVSIPSGVKKAHCAMCQSITAVVVPNGVTEVNFTSCRALAFVSIPNSVTQIDGNTFNFCCSLESITIPNSVTSIGGEAFRNCYSLRTVNLSNGVTSIGDSVFYDCQSLVSVNMPNSLKSIGNNAFYDCYILKSVTLPNGVTSVGNSAFFYCSSLVSVNIPNSLTSIGTNTFFYCKALASITIPNGVTSIGASAFTQATGVSVYDFTSHTVVPTLGNSNAFTGIPSDCQILVPASLYDEWIAATNWSTYASKIVAV